MPYYNYVIEFHPRGVYVGTSARPRDRIAFEHFAVGKRKRGNRRLRKRGANLSTARIVRRKFETRDEADRNERKMAEAYRKTGYEVISSV